MKENFPALNSSLHFSKDQKIGIIILFAIIIALQSGYYFTDFSFAQPQTKEEKEWLSLQSSIDSLKNEKQTSSYKMYPFNPNYISDFKAYKLGMNTAQIDRLLAFRKEGKFANSAQEFQKVTGISDSLLNTMAPYFKFPDWVTNKKGNYKEFKSNWKEYPKKEALKILDVNSATKDDFMKIYGIGEAISDRILTQRALLGAFVSMDQMNEIWGLSAEVQLNLQKYFTINKTPTVKKIDINNASIKELSQFVYFRFPISKNIVTYRSMNGAITMDNLSNIKGFPVDKIKIIALYLEF